MPENCIACNAVLDDESCAGVCKGCLQPERIRAAIADVPGPLGDALRRISRDFGLTPSDDAESLAADLPNFAPTPGVTYTVSDGLKRRWGWI